MCIHQLSPMLNLLICEYLVHVLGPAFGPNHGPFKFINLRVHGLDEPVQGCLRKGVQSPRSPSASESIDMDMNDDTREYFVLPISLQTDMPLSRLAAESIDQDEF